MDQRVNISELRRHPMRIVRLAAESAEGATISCRGIAVAVLRACGAPLEDEPGPGAAPSSRTESPDLGTPGEAPTSGGGWPMGTAEPQDMDVEGVLDSASWGQWEALSDAERRALVSAIQQRRSSLADEVSCGN